MNLINQLRVVTMRCILSALLLAAFTNSLIASECKLNVSPISEADVVISAGDIRRVTGGGIFDSPISSYRVDGQVFWVLPTVLLRNSRIFLKHTILRGRDLAVAKPIGTYGQEAMFAKSAEGASDMKGLKWITNLYQNKNGILAFVHVEYAGKNDHWGMPCMTTHSGQKVCGPGTSKIGLAWMETPGGFDGIPRFKYIGHIASFVAHQPHFNVMGTPYSITTRGGVEYLNILFGDKNHVSRHYHVAWARAPLKEVIAAARRGRVSKWLKYNNGEWEDALNGFSSSVLPEAPELAATDPRIARGQVIVHSDIVKHVETGRFFLSAYTPANERFPSSFVFYDSCDGASWRLNSIANSRKDETPSRGWSYMSFVNEDGSDNGEASGSFNLLSAYEYVRPKKHIVKFSVSVPENCSCD